MIDLHTHILPDIDDGSQDLETTQQMLEAQVQEGVHTVVATPHYSPAKLFPTEFLRLRNAAMEQVATLHRDSPKLIPGAEVEYFFGMGSSGILQDLQLGNSGLLLIEMPFCPWTQRMVQEICNLPEQTGLQPVLAHVDRYRTRKQFLRYMNVFLENGILFQLNALAFLAPNSRRWALKMMKKGYVHFLGSDTHNMAGRPPNLGKAAQIITKKLGTEPLEKLTAYTAEMLKL